MKKKTGLIILVSVFVGVPILLMVAGLRTSLKFQEDHDFIRMPKLDCQIQENQLVFSFLAQPEEPRIRLDDITVHQDVVVALGVTEPPGFERSAIDEEFHKAMESTLESIGEKYDGRDYVVFSGELDVPQGESRSGGCPNRC